MDPMYLPPTAPSMSPVMPPEDNRDPPMCRLVRRRTEVIQMDEVAQHEFTFTMKGTAVTITVEPQGITRQATVYTYDPKAGKMKKHSPTELQQRERARNFKAMLDQYDKVTTYVT